MEKQLPPLNDTIFLFKKKLRNHLPKALLNLYFSFYPIIGNIIFGKPSRKIKLIGITGTDGKSSTVIFTARLLRAAGYKVGCFSSVSYSEGEEDITNTFKMTMPGRLFLQRFIQTLVNNNCDIGIIEVTSEGVKQKRNLCIDFDVVCITNLNHEHIESHGGFENYKLTKASLFKNLRKSYHKGLPKTTIVNTDDPLAKEFISYDSEKLITFGMSGNPSILVSIIASDFFTSTFSISHNNETHIVSMNAGGPFIIENVLASLAICSAFGVSLSTLVQSFETISNPPGRFEIVSTNPFVIVDYAHTIAGVEKLLSFVRKNWNGNIIHVFGAAGGGRDIWKRPELARLSEKYTTQSILTEENPFDEPTVNIIEDIRKGFSEQANVLSFAYRKDAVEKGLEIATQNKSLLLLTAKGSETVIAGPCGKKFPYNEKETVLCLLHK